MEPRYRFMLQKALKIAFVSELNTVEFEFRLQFGHEIKLERESESPLRFNRACELKIYFEIEQKKGLK